LPQGHVPPQPLSPQVLPSQTGLQTQVPAGPHIWPAGHVPQDPPQPFDPQVLPAQFGVHGAQEPRDPLRTHRREQHRELSLHDAPPGRHLSSPVSSPWDDASRLPRRLRSFAAASAVNPRIPASIAAMPPRRLAFAPSTRAMSSIRPSSTIDPLSREPAHLPAVRD